MEPLLNRTDSIILIFIGVIVAAILALKPLIKMWLASKEKRHQMDVDQKNKFIDVIQANTEVNSSLKQVLEDDRKRCDDCRTEQRERFKNIQDGQENANIKLAEIHTILTKEGV